MLRSTLKWITEKELEQDIKKTMEANFTGRKTWKLKSSGEKMRNASGHPGENERLWKKKKSEKEHIRYFLHKRVRRKFLAVSRCSRTKQRQRNVPKGVLHESRQSKARLPNSRECQSPRRSPSELFLKGCPYEGPSFPRLCLELTAQAKA